MTSKKIKRLLIIMIIISVMVVIIIITAFILNFKNHNVSNQISDWGAFGDYFGGVLNTSISFISLLILSFLTYLISKQSNIENKKNNMLMKKMNAYENLTSYLPIYNQSLTQIPNSTDLIGNKNINEVSLAENRNEVYQGIRDFSEAHYFLFSFKVRYSHLFEYDFSSKEFQSLIENSKKMNDFMNSIKETFDLNENRVIEIGNLPEKFFDSLTELINSLRDELE